MDLLSPGHVVHLPGSEGVEPCAGERAAAAAQAGRPLRGNILAEADSGQRQVAPAQRHHLHNDVVPEQTQMAFNKRINGARGSFESRGSVPRCLNYFSMVCTTNMHLLV